MSFKDNFKKFIENQVEATIDLIFANAHGYAMTESGDITPEQAFELDKIKEQLQELVYKQTVQNLTQEQLKDLKLDGIECGNCGFDMGSGYENNGGAEDGTCNECGHTQEEEPVLWNVPVMRTGYGHSLIAVTARSEEEAIELALEQAGGEDFSEKSSEYEAPDGAHKIG